MALAIALNRPFDDIIKMFKHDGSELLYPELKDVGRRAFHMQEIIPVALECGYAAVQVFPHNEIRQADETRYEKSTFINDMTKYNGIYECVKDNVGHAFARFDNKIYNPTTGLEAEPSTWELLSYVALIKVSK